MFLKTIFLYLTSCAFLFNPCSAGLHQDIFKNYSYLEPPSKKFDVGLGLALRSLNNVDHVDGTLETNIWLRHYWNDPRLAWNLEDYNITKTVVSTHRDDENKIWVPDIYLYNTAELPMNQLTNSFAMLYNNGDIIWSRPGIIKSTCRFNLERFPYDNQDCYLKFGSWSYSGETLNLSIVGLVDLSNYKEGEEWEITRTWEELEIKTYACCPEPYYSVIFHINIERMSRYYVANIIIPIFATSSLLVVSMMIPWESGERISFTTTIMLTIVVFLLILSDNLPKTNDVPMLTNLVTGLMFFSLGVVFITVLISSLRTINKEESIFSKLIFKTFIKCCDNKCLKNNKNIQRRSISYDHAINIAVDEEIHKICKRFSVKVEHFATILFAVVFAGYCTAAVTYM